MNLQYAIYHVEIIRESSGDYEVAHSMEDKLREEFLEFVCSDHCKDLNETKAIAAAILKSSQIEFDRHCA